MKGCTASLLFLLCLAATALPAQTTIGGVACTSTALSGTYAVSLTARQVTAAGAYTGVFQSNGSASFDGESGVTINLTANTGKATATPLTWSGTYSVQANCAGVINITSGGSATLNLAIYRVGANPVTFNFLLSGSDSTYTYSGTGNTTPATACTAATFSGVYTFSGTGFALTSGNVSGAENGAGLMQFDGVSAITVNLTMWAGAAAASPLALTGSYSVSAACLGTATLTDASNNSYVMSFSIYNNSVANAAAYTTLTQSSKFLVSGAIHTAYGQPSTTAAVQAAQGGRA